MHLHALVHHELDNLFSILPEPYTSPLPPRSHGKSPAREAVFQSIIPFELLVYRARAHGLLGRLDVSLAMLFELVRTLPCFARAQR